MKYLQIVCIAAMLIGFAPKVSAQDEVDEELIAFMLDFTDKLELLVADYENNFDNLKGAVRPKSSEYDVMDSYYSNVNLPEAEESYIASITGTDRLTYVAVFADTEDAEEAYDLYTGIAFLAELTDCDCCTFTSNAYDEPSDLYLMRTVFIPEFKTGFKEKFEKMNLMVSIYPSFDISEDFEMFDTYMVVLNINTKE